MKVNPAFSELDLIRSITRESFYEFVREFWDTVITEPAVWNWHIEFLCAELQVAASRVMRGEAVPYDILINIPPGTTKSTIVSVMFPAWVWTKWPQAQFICGSYAHLLALDLARKCRDVIRSELYQACFGLELREDQDTKGLFQNQYGGWRLACTPSSTATGFHAHFILVDDPINPGDAISEAKLTEANRWMRETLPSRKVNKAVAVTVLIMQRLHQNDPSAQMLNLAASSPNAIPVRHICLPARLSDDVRPRKLRAMYSEDGLLDAIRLNQRVIAQLTVQLGEFGASGQLQQRPVPAEGGMFKVDKMPFKPMPIHYRRSVRYWDKAGTGGAGAFTVGVRMIEDMDGLIGIVDVVRGQWEAAERERMIRQTAELDGKGTIVGVEQEPGSGGKESAEHTIRKTLFGFRCYAERPTGDKTFRADPFAAQVNMGGVWILENGLWVPAYLEELRFFPLSTYRDQVDASSGAFAYLAKSRIRVGAARG